MDKPHEPLHFESLYPENTRFPQIEKILSLIKQGNSAQVVGLPGVGRSNLLRLLAYNNGLRVKHLGENYRWYHFVYMDLSEVRGKDPYELIKFILISLAYSLSERKMDEEHNKVNEYLKEAVGFKDSLILFQALKHAVDYLSIEKELTVVLLFDRFDAFFPKLDNSFFADLRVLRNRAKYRFSSIFSAPRPLEELLEEGIFADFYEFLVGNSVYLPINDEATDKFRFQYLEKVSGKNVDEKLKKRIMEETGGHGKLTRIAFEAILAEDKIPENLTQFLLERNGIKGALLEIWNALTPEEQKTLISKDLSNADSYLTLSGLVLEGQISIPLFVANLDSFPKPATEKISYEIETQEIRKGEQSITDKLSPSEFKLLRFLITNQDRVCEKEEIISAVWTDAKTQEGVTDQALDQIVYRVRRKIEADPNNPTHILTVKGRGYKFSG